MSHFQQKNINISVDFIICITVSPSIVKMTPKKSQSSPQLLKEAVWRFIQIKYAGNLGNVGGVSDQKAKSRIQRFAGIVQQTR